MYTKLKERNLSALVQAKTIAEAHNVENSKVSALAAELKAQVEQAASKAAAEEAKRAEEQSANEARLAELQAAEKTSVKEAVTRLLQLTYFSKVRLSDSSCGLQLQPTNAAASPNLRRCMSRIYQRGDSPLSFYAGK